MGRRAYGPVFYQAHSLSQPLLLAAIGTGMAPILGVARAALKAGHQGPIYCVMGAKRRAWPLPLPGLHQVAAAPNVHIYYIVQQAGQHSDTYEVGDIYRKIRELLPDMSGQQAYICGAPVLCRSLKTVFLAGANLTDIFCRRIFAKLNSALFTRQRFCCSCAQAFVGWRSLALQPRSPMHRRFPTTRMRRNRFAEFSRRLVRETELSAGDFIYPMFCWRAIIAAKPFTPCRVLSGLAWIYWPKK